MMSANVERLAALVSSGDTSAELPLLRELARLHHRVLEGPPESIPDNVWWWLNREHARCELILWRVTRNGPYHIGRRPLARRDRVLSACGRAKQLNTSGRPVARSFWQRHNHARFATDLRAVRLCAHCVHRLSVRLGEQEQAITDGGRA